MYKRQGIDGFWNDMNEPALFYSEKNLKKTMEELKKYVGKDLSLQELWDFKDLVNGLATVSYTHLDVYKRQIYNRQRSVKGRL